MKIKTNDLTGPALDWAVAKCEGKADDTEYHGGNLWYGRVTSGFNMWSPSTDWSRGGPIIEQECMVSSCFAPLPDSLHYDPANPTRKQWFFWTDKTGMVAGPTPLIAAMRCFVVSRLGDEVDIPEELLT